MMNEDLIQKVPLFQQSSQVCARRCNSHISAVDCLQAFQHKLIASLEPQIYSPGDVIIRAGEVGACSVHIQAFCYFHLHRRQ